VERFRDGFKLGGKKYIYKSGSDSVIRGSEFVGGEVYGVKSKKALVVGIRRHTTAYDGIRRHTAVDRLVEYMRSRNF
jgi:hypothetical protein